LAGYQLRENGGQLASRKTTVLVFSVIALMIIVAAAAIRNWAAPLSTGLGPEMREELTVKASVDTSSSLVVSVTNVGPNNSNVTAVLFNDSFIEMNSVSLGGGSFVKNNDGSFSLAKGSSGTLIIAGKSLGVPLAGSTYQVTVETSRGDTYPANVTWP
jgi:hypothetical protein